MAFATTGSRVGAPGDCLGTGSGEVRMALGLEQKGGLWHWMCMAWFAYEQKSLVHESTSKQASDGGTWLARGLVSSP
eukprot:14967036-Alexandrium_andersonii.AAC.1